MDERGFVEGAVRVEGREDMGVVVLEGDGLLKGVLLVVGLLGCVGTGVENKGFEVSAGIVVTCAGDGAGLEGAELCAGMV